MNFEKMSDSAEPDTRYVNPRLGLKTGLILGLYTVALCRSE